MTHWTDVLFVGGVVETADYHLYLSEQHLSCKCRIYHSLASRMKHCELLLTL